MFPNYLNTRRQSQIMFAQILIQGDQIKLRIETNDQQLKTIAMYSHFPCLSSSSSSPSSTSFISGHRTSAQALASIGAIRKTVGSPWKTTITQAWITDWWTTQGPQCDQPLGGPRGSCGSKLYLVIRS